MRVFGIAGYKNAGKTTLVVALVAELKRRGRRVATVKHAHHDFDIDHPGKDSYRHREAGAVEVIVASGRRWAHIRELHDRPEPPLDALLDCFGDVDLVLVEGYKGGSHPKLELRRAAVPAPAIAGNVPGVIAIVADTPLPDETLPVIAVNDIAAIADLVEQAARPRNDNRNDSRNDS